MSHLKALLIAIVAVSAPLAACSSPETSTAAQTVTVTATPSPQPDLFEGYAPGGGTYELCDSQSARATNVTSCEFAVAVAQAFRYGGSNAGNVHAYSPVMLRWYDMDCVKGYTARTRSGRDVPATKCTGGINAVVVIVDN